MARRLGHRTAALFAPPPVLGTSFFAIVVGAVLVSTLGNWLLAQFGHVFAFEAQADLRLQMFDGLAHSAPREIAGRRTGDLASVAMGDVDALEAFFAHLGIGAAVAVHTGGVSAAALVAIHPVLGLIGVAGMLAAVVLPVAVPAGWQPPDAGSPVPWLLAAPAWAARISWPHSEYSSVVALISFSALA